MRGQVFTGISYNQSLTLLLALDKKKYPVVTIASLPSYGKRRQIM